MCEKYKNLDNLKVKDIHKLEHSYARPWRIQYYSCLR